MNQEMVDGVACFQSHWQQKRMLVVCERVAYVVASGKTRR